MQAMPFQLLLALGVMFLGIATTNMAGSLGRRGTTTATGAIGISLILSAMAWSRVAPYLSTAFVSSFVEISANGYVWLGMLAAAWIYFAAKNLRLETQVAEGARAKLPPKVIVLQSPRDGERVVQEATVRGFIYPASSKPVQILIQSGAPNDLWWYPQLPGPRTDGYEWIRDRCAFGFPNIPGSRHSIVAISSNEAVTQRTKELPPDAVKSNVVTVYRY